MLPGAESEFDTPLRPKSKNVPPPPPLCKEVENVLPTYNKGKNVSGVWPPRHPPPAPPLFATPLGPRDTDDTLAGLPTPPLVSQELCLWVLFFLNLTFHTDKVFLSPKHDSVYSQLSSQFRSWMISVFVAVLVSAIQNVSVVFGLKMFL